MFAMRHPQEKRQTEKKAAESGIKASMSASTCNGLGISRDKQGLTLKLPLNTVTKVDGRRGVHACQVKRK